MLGVNAAAVPSTLSSRMQWILWRTEDRGGKPTKVPVRTNGYSAKSNDPDTWSSFRAALHCYQQQPERYAGIGYVFASDDPFAGIDLDGCRDPESGKVADWAKQIIVECGSYAEVSPSETGVKIFIQAKSPLASGRKVELPDAERVCDKAPAIEIYDQLRYFAVTGYRLQGMSAEPLKRQEWLDKLCAAYFPEPEYKPPPDTPWDSPRAVIDRASKYVARMPPAISGQSGHNAAFHVACVLVLGFGLPVNDAYSLFCEYNQTCDPPWSEREIRHKLESANKQEGQRNYLRDVHPKRWSTVSIPDYKPTRALPESGTLREAAEKYIDRIEAGQQKLVSLGIAEVDYAIGGGVEYGEIVVIGARPSHGKTTVGLQTLWTASADGLPTLIVSEEMSKMALGKRSVQFASEIHEEHWRVQAAGVRQDLAEHFDKRASCYVVESCGTAERAADVIRQHVNEHGVKLCVVDYAQLLSGKGRSRYEQISSASVVLRQLATELKIVMVVLCQLNRAIESRDKFSPKLSDLRDSGQIEQDADVILFLVWPHRLDEKRDPHEYHVFVSKNRNRAINQHSLKCKFLPGRQMIVEEKSAFITADQYREQYFPEPANDEF